MTLISMVDFLVGISHPLNFICVLQVAFRPPCRKRGHVPGSFRAKVPKSTYGFTIVYRWRERLRVGALRSCQKGDPGHNKVFVASQTWRWCRHYNWGLETREVKLGLGKRYGYGNFQVAKQPTSSLVKQCRQFTTEGKKSTIHVWSPATTIDHNIGQLQNYWLLCRLHFLFR
jgi:hypothetical protein